MEYNNVSRIRRRVWLSESSSSAASSASCEIDQPPSKIIKVELVDPIQIKLSHYLDQVSGAGRSGEFVMQTEPCHEPATGLRVIEVIVINLIHVSFHFTLKVLTYLPMLIYT